MWAALGFRESPYDVRPLRATAADVDLLVGRTPEAVALYTTLETHKEGALILSGLPGVGKTSFLNVAQHRLAEGKAPFGPRVLPALELCPIQPSDTPRAVALRALKSVIVSLEVYCRQHVLTMPAQAKRANKWLNSAGGKGFEIGVQILGTGANFGRETSIPPVSEASFEAIRDLLLAVVTETTSTFGVAAVVIALDNLENLEESRLLEMLLAFRDTLLSVPGVWWVLIGFSGLGAFIRMNEPKVAERLAGSGIELPSLSLDELDEAIEKRVSRFTATPGARSPLASEIHRELFDASNGEIRFVFHYSNMICARFVEAVRVALIKDRSEAAASKAFANEIAKRMIERQIPTEVARTILRELVGVELTNLKLKSAEIRMIGRLAENGEARPSDYRKFGLKSAADFVGRFLTPLSQKHLLARRQEGAAVFYSVRGVPALAAKYGLLSPKA